MKAGEVLRVKSTDMGFAKDVESWCSRTGNTFISSEREGFGHIVTLQKGENSQEGQCSILETSTPVDLPQGKTMVVFDGDFDKALAAFKEVGLAPSYFRAPYGLYNLTLLILIKTHGMKPFQWDYLLGDWKEEDDFVLLNKLKDKARDKNVLVLHDGTEGSADPGAKDKMLKEVRIFLDEERENKKSHN